MLNIKNMDEVMNNKDYTMIIDGKSPAGMIKFRHEATQEIVYVVVNETLAENTLKVMAVNANATVDHASENKEDNTMAQNNNTQATQAQAANNTSKKEEKKMTLKERWLANLKNGEELGYKATRKTGYAVGYATTTVKEEVAYAARKVTKGISETRVAKEVRNGYYDGKNDAMTAFDCRVSEREYKAEQKNLKAAVEELMDEFEDFDDSVCGDGIWNNKMA